MISNPVLVLNQNYQPLNICRVRRAVVLMTMGKAEMLENGAGFIHSATDLFPVPTVIRLPYLIKLPRVQKKLTRFEIFIRDKFTCQYCGTKTRQLTLDHVIPRYRNGEHSWENVVSACVACNRRKAGRTPAEAHMKLIHPPVKPHDGSPFYIPLKYQPYHPWWQKYLLQ
jgi:5-methylcytosine-specific restriction endonuclease McrA